MSKEIERYADRLKPKTKVARCRPLTSLLKLNSAYFPRELLQGLQHEKLNKEISESTLQPDSAKNVNLRKMDYLEKLEKVKDGKPEKEKKEDEDEDEGNEENEEEEEEIGEDDYHENFGFDDDEDYLDDVDDGGLDIGDCY
ncbi:hypothetical protein AMTR_s00085p00072220 [Amborella trichopoda]|uniref:DNA-directed RNA polymerase III subunit n=2 Tax=Amborella trichopoda TaxID=13333 RepID=W1P6S5_AMBTC|nr:hypothetical protein AMTR_s00085p00072220 [Amborella trichopoda]